MSAVYVEPAPVAPFRIMLSSGSWERGIETVPAALRSWRSARRAGLIEAAIYDAVDQRIGPDGTVWEEIG